jgi:hypothetical protein
LATIAPLKPVSAGNRCANRLDREGEDRKTIEFARLPGWKFGWRDEPIAGDRGRRYVETYCYAFAGRDFLEDEVQQFYWRTDIVQMTRYFMIEAAHSGYSPFPHGARNFRCNGP